MSKATVIIGHTYGDGFPDDFVKIFEIKGLMKEGLLNDLKNCVHEAIIDHQEMTDKLSKEEWKLIEPMTHFELMEYLEEYDMTMMVKVEI